MVAKSKSAVKSSAAKEASKGVSKATAKKAAVEKPVETPVVETPVVEEKAPVTPKTDEKTVVDETTQEKTTETSVEGVFYTKLSSFISKIASINKEVKELQAMGKTLEKDFNNVIKVKKKNWLYKQNCSKTSVLPIWPRAMHSLG